MDFLVKLKKICKLKLLTPIMIMIPINKLVFDSTTLLPKKFKEINALENKHCFWYFPKHHNEFDSHNIF